MLQPRKLALSELVNMYVRGTKPMAWTGIHLVKKFSVHRTTAGGSFVEYCLRFQNPLHISFQQQHSKDNSIALPCGCSTGDLIFRGDVSDVSVMASGTGTAYVSGVTDSVTVSLSGIGNAAIDAASGAKRCQNILWFHVTLALYAVSVRSVALSFHFLLRGRHCWHCQSKYPVVVRK
jgi:hypothetical protein